jgi:hypothetical protein
MAKLSHAERFVIPRNQWWISSFSPTIDYTQSVSFPRRRVNAVSVAIADDAAHPSASVSLKTSNPSSGLRRGTLPKECNALYTESVSPPAFISSWPRGFGRMK